MRRHVLAIGMILTAFAVGCGESEAEKKHKAELKAIAAKTTTKETQAFLEGCGPTKSAAEAEACLKKQLDAWKRGDGGLRVHSADLLLAKLLDYKLVETQAHDAYFQTTVALQLELSGGPGMVGGGASANRQQKYKIDQRLGAITMSP